MMEMTTMYYKAVLMLLCMTSMSHAMMQTGTSHSNYLIGILFKGVDKRMDELQRKNTLLVKKVTLLTTQMNSFLYVRRGIFSATRHTHIYLSKGQTLVFNVVQYNLGQDYNPGTGIFTCPIHGVYLFHLNVITSAKESRLSAEIMKSGVRIGVVWEQGTNGRHHSTSVTVFTECDKGEKVWVRVSHPSTILFWGNGFPHFSGAFIHPLK